MANGPSLGELTNRAARLLRQFADRRLEPLGLSSGYLPVLTSLMAAEAMSQKDLTKHAVIEQPTMAATLGRMERDGIIERQPDPYDKRSFLFSLTPATRGKVVTIRETIESLNAEVLANLPDEDRAKAKSLLRSMISSLERLLNP